MTFWDDYGDPTAVNAAWHDVALTVSVSSAPVLIVTLVVQLVQIVVSWAFDRAVRAFRPLWFRPPVLAPPV